MTLSLMVKRSVQITSVLVLSFVLLSCGGKRKSAYSPSYSTEKSKEQVFSDVLNNMVSYDKMEARVSLSISMGNSSLNSKGVLRIIKDSLIQLSVQPLIGLEMFKFHMDKDSLFIIDRMNKIYVKELLTDVKRRYPITPDLYCVQALLSNRLFVMGQKGVDESDFNNFDITNSESEYNFDIKKSENSLRYNFSVNTDYLIDRTHIVRDGSSLAMTWNYSDFDKLMGHNFPNSIQILAHGNQEKMSTEIVYDKIVINSDFKTKMSISSKFRRVSLTDLLDIIPSHR